MMGRSLTIAVVLFGSLTAVRAQSGNAPGRGDAADEMRARQEIERLHAADLKAQAEFERRRVPRQWTEDQLERMVFNADVSMTRKHLGTQLSQQLAALQRTCHLTDVQRNKLQLAGRGDIKRLFDSYEAVKRRALVMEAGGPQLSQVQDELNRLRVAVQSELFHEDSLLVRALHTTLTAEQLAKYEALAQARRQTRHRTCIQEAIGILERGIALGEGQRRELLTLLANETQPSRRPGPYDAYILVLQLGRLPQAKLRRLFSEAQWEIVSEHLARYQLLEPMLQQLGQLPTERTGSEHGEERGGSS